METIKKKRIAWNKGIKTGLVPKTVFKKGIVAWNKGLIGFGLGHIGAMLGKKHTDKTKNKISNTKKGKMPKNIRQISGWNKGLRMSDEVKKKISISRTGKCLGDRNSLWKGGKMKLYPEIEQIRKSTEMILCRKACMERDFFTCAKTGQRGGRLVVHHINNFADFPELRTSINNGITLSKESHILFHKIYGKKNNTREQLLEFLTNK